MKMNTGGWKLAKWIKMDLFVMDLKGRRWMKICKKILILNFWTHERQVSSGHSRCLWVDLSSTLSEVCQEPILFLRPPGCTRSQWLSVIAKHLPKAQQVHQTLQNNALQCNRASDLRSRWVIGSTGPGGGNGALGLFPPMSSSSVSQLSHHFDADTSTISRRLCHAMFIFRLWYHQRCKWKPLISPTSDSN